MKTADEETMENETVILAGKTDYLCELNPLYDQVKSVQSNNAFLCFIRAVMVTSEKLPLVEIVKAYIKQTSKAKKMRTIYEEVKPFINWKATKYPKFYGTFKAKLLSRQLSFIVAYKRNVIVYLQSIKK